jgi:hypothetical protein
MSLASRPRLRMRRTRLQWPSPAAILTAHAQHIELADEIAEIDCAIAGHVRPLTLRYVTTVQMLQCSAHG